MLVLFCECDSWTYNMQVLGMLINGDSTPEPFTHCPWCGTVLKSTIMPQATPPQ